MKVPSKGLVFIAAFINTLVLLFLTTWLWSLPWFAGDEKAMIWITSAIKFNFREIPESREYAFINVAYDPQLIDKYDENGFPIGYDVITDRQKLARLFHIINQSPKKPAYILCDIFFEKSTPYDSLLENEMKSMDNLIVSYHLDDELQPRFPVIENVNRGLTDYVIGNVFEGVYKFQLYFNDSLPLTPLMIYDDINNIESKKWGPLVKLDGWWTLNHFIMNYRLLQMDVQQQQAGFNPVNLGELLILPNDEDIAGFLEGKFVEIGDFSERDMHETIFEITSGPVILVNALWSLQHRDTRVNLVFFMILFASFFFLSYLAIYPEDLLEKYIRRKYGRIRWVKSLTSFVSYLLFLIITSVLTFFIFNVHLNVFLLAVYLFVLEKVSNFLTGRKQPEPVAE